MLIASPRHTEADLRLWSEYEEADLLRKRHVLETKAAHSVDAIRAFAAAGPCYAGVSWGKDSVVLFDLLGKADAGIPAVWLTYGRATNPECRLVRDAARERWPGIVYHEIDVGESEAMRDDFRPAALATGARRYLSGVRADESGTRAMSLRHLGLASANVCRPLGWWTVSDVFAYLAIHGLPVHPNYAMLGGGRWERKQLRTASIGGDRGNNFGRAEWEREYYGDVLRRLESNSSQLNKNV